jgi:type II secretory pathway pseudopilin PulG
MLMKRVLGDAAFTIVETMIFLAISSFLFAMVVISFNGQQNRTQFTQSVKDFESRLLDIANDVANGLYASNNNFGCTNNPITPDPVVFSGPVTSKGGNTGCIFAGQVIRFTNNSPTFTVTALAGKQKIRAANGQDREVSTIAEANPVAIPGGPITMRTDYQANIVNVRSSVGMISAIAIVSNFNSYTDSNLDSGDTNADVIPLVGATPTNPAGWTAASNGRNPTSGITICLQNGNGGAGTMRGTVRLGGQGKQLTTFTDIAPGVCP